MGQQPHVARVYPSALPVLFEAGQKMQNKLSTDNFFPQCAVNMLKKAV